MQIAYFHQVESLPGFLPLARILSAVEASKKKMEKCDNIAGFCSSRENHGGACRPGWIFSIPPQEGEFYQEVVLQGLRYKEGIYLVTSTTWWHLPSRPATNHA
jgi:hypothetical protein